MLRSVNVPTLTLGLDMGRNQKGTSGLNVYLWLDLPLDAEFGAHLGSARSYDSTKSGEELQTPLHFPMKVCSETPCVVETLGNTRNFLEGLYRTPGLGTL